MAEEKEMKFELNQLNDRHEFEVFKKENFTGKHINNIKFNNIHFLDCDFTGAVISICEFNEKCLFNKCTFNGTTFLNCKFNDTTISECSFSASEFTDVNIGSDCNIKDNNWSNDCKINNFIFRGEKLEDISQIISVVGDDKGESLETEPENTPTSGTVEEDINAEELGELESRQDPEVDFKLYNALFPEILKQYPALQKGDYGYETTVDNVDFSISPDNDSSAWRYVFMIKDTDDSLGSDVVTVGTDKEITYDTLKEAFETTIKGEIQNIVNKTESQVVKSSLKKFSQEVFKDNNIITEALTSDTVLVDVYDSPEDAIGFFSVGYDKVNNKTCIIVGKPFLTDNIAEGNTVRDQIKQNGFIINNDINTMTDQELFDYAKTNPYTCFVYEHSDLVDRVNARTFSPKQIVIIK